MKKYFLWFLVLLLLTTSAGTAFAEERMVQLTVPGCSA